MLTREVRPFGQAVVKTGTRRHSTAARAGISGLARYPITEARTGSPYGKHPSRPFTSGKGSRKLPDYNMLSSEFKIKSEGSLRPPPNVPLYVTNCPFPGKLSIDGRVYDSPTIFFKKIFEKAAAQFFTGDRTLEGDLSSKHVEALVRNIFGFKDTSGGSNPLDGLQLGLNSEGEVVVYLGIDPKKIAVPANERAAKTIEIKFSSGSNGASLQENWKIIDKSLEDAYGNKKKDKPTIAEKFFVLLEANPTPINSSNAIDTKINQLIPDTSFSSFIFNVYTFCLGYTKSITDVSGVNIIVPNSYGNFKQKTVETKKQNGTTKVTKSLSFFLNKATLVTDKFRGLTSHICVLDTKPSEDVINLLKNEFPDYELSLHSEIKSPGVYQHFLCFTKVVFQKRKAEGFVVNHTTKQLVLRPENYNDPNVMEVAEAVARRAETYNNEENVAPYESITLPTVARNAVAAAALPNQSPSPPMKGGYKRRRTTCRKPRRT
jgi:hypothetical protein